MNRIMIALAVLSLAACGGTPCEQYVSAFEDCAASSGADATVEAGVCDADDGSQDEYFECAADAINSGDCSTEAGAAEAILASLACAGDLTGGSDTGN